MKCTIEKDTDWREHYREVLFQPDPEKLPMAIEVALQAVQRRTAALWDVQPPDRGELTQLAYALYILGLLRAMTEPEQEAERPDWLSVKPEERLS
jgi:hypothetical protein